MSILSFWADKGGTGKTTLATNVSAALDLPLFDLDPQGDSIRWAGASGLECSTVEESQTRAFLRAHANGKRLVICDLPPGQPGLPVAGLSDVCIVPTRPGEADLVALGRALVQLDQVRKAGNPDLKVGVVLTQARVGSNRTRLIDAWLQGKAGEEGFVYLGALHHRVSIEVAGVTPGQQILKLKDGAAAHEFRSLLTGIVNLLRT